MSSDSDTAKLLFEYLRQAIYSPDDVHIDLELLPPEFREFGEGLQFLAKCLGENKRFALALSKGEFDAQSPPSENIIAGPLKTIQNFFKHLTWQTQQITKGDYGQSLDFMGEFADAFNTMVEQLKERKEAMDKRANDLREFAFHDPLTGLYNRNYAMMVMQGWMDAKKEFFVVNVDIDNVKLVNDILGHEVGDKYIIEIAGALKELESCPVLCRTSGDEFLAFAEDTTRAELDAALGALRTKVMRVSDGGSNHDYRRSFSFGIVKVNPDNTHSMDKLLSLANGRMAQNKIANKAARFKRQGEEI